MLNVDEPPVTGVKPVAESGTTRGEAQVSVPDTLLRVRRRSGRKRFLRLSLGVLNVLLGIVGLLVPGILGVLHLVIALLLFSPDVPVARRWVLGIFRRWPAVRRRVPKRLRRMGRGDFD